MYEPYLKVHTPVVCFDWKGGTEKNSDYSHLQPPAVACGTRSVIYIGAWKVTNASEMHASTARTVRRVLKITNSILINREYAVE